MRSVKKIIFYAVLFSIAMGFMESAVVIYLREIFYPAGFRFPLTPIPFRLSLVEVLREAATVTMLICIGFFTGRNKVQRFAFFCLAFSVWDLFYYLFLYLLLGWPASWCTWDILFLIPVPWVGPVWASCLLSSLMLCGSVFVIIKTENNPNYRIRKIEWLLMTGGAVICISLFMTDYFRQAKFTIKDAVLSSDGAFTSLHSYIPQQFNYILFFCGFALMLGTVISNVLFTNKKTNHEKK